MKKTYLFPLLLLVSSCISNNKYSTLSQEVLEDKVKGAWASKMVGVMYGREMEFKAVGKTFDDPIPWEPKLIEKSLLEDDIYGQLSFMQTFEKNGKQTTLKDLAYDFAHANFPLCHANLQARKNIFEGKSPIEAGHPEYSMHADDIDFQIESDFIGFMHPGMPQSSNLMCDSVGRIMSYGDGLYGGMFVTAMHTNAYFENDINKIVENGLKSIPKNSTYAQCIQDVITCFEKNPNDWKYAWKTIEDKWAKDDICVPYHDFNIDAKLNGAYIAIGLLYGKGDFQKTMEITIRCGQDTDCNSANAAAVLGIKDGFKSIPDNFISYLPEIADKHFLHTNYSFNKAVEQTIKHIEQNVVNNGGEIKNGVYKIKTQAHKFDGKVEQSYPNKIMSYQIQMKESEKWKLSGNWINFVYGDGDSDLYKKATTPNDILELEFEGTGISLLGSWNTSGGSADVYLDGKFVKHIDTYFREEAGKYDVNRAHIFHHMNLSPGKHTLKLIVSKDKNEKSTGHDIWVERAVVYKDK